MILPPCGFKISNNMHSQICPPQSSYSPGNAATQFWRSIDAGSSTNRRVVLMPSAATNVTGGGGTTMSSPGPTPPTPLSHRHSPAARSAPASPAPPPPPPPPHPPARGSTATGHPSTSYNIMHFPRQPPGCGNSSQHVLVSTSCFDRFVKFLFVLISMTRIMFITLMES